MHEGQPLGMAYPVSIARWHDGNAHCVAFHHCIIATFCHGDVRTEPLIPTRATLLAETPDVTRSRRASDSSTGCNTSIVSCAVSVAQACASPHGQPVVKSIAPSQTEVRVPSRVEPIHISESHIHKFCTRLAPSASRACPLLCKCPDVTCTENFLG